MADLTPEALAALVRLMNDPPDATGLSDEQIVAAAQSARAARKRAEGIAAAELHRRGWTWERIGAALGVNGSTAFRWARPYIDHQ